MPRTRANVETNNFTGGLITEASPLAFPEKASIDTKNIVFNKDGSAQRRLGLEQEQGGEVFANLYRPDSPIHIYRWDSPNGNPNLSFICIAVDIWIFFLDAYKSNPSANGIGYVQLGFPKLYNTYSMVSTSKRLLVSIGDSNLSVISYNETNNSFSIDTQRIQIRDFYGYKYDPRSLEKAAIYTGAITEKEMSHYYNLRNSGWTPSTLTNYNNTIASSGTRELPPLNAQVFFGKDSSNNFQPSLVGKEFFGNTRAPQGHVIMDLYNRGGDKLSYFDGWVVEDKNINSTVAFDSSKGGIVDLEFFAGRAFYILSESATLTNSLEYNVNTPEISNFVCFSQIVDKEENLTKCYQAADPTSEDISDIVATDGGVIAIQGMKNPIAIKEYLNNVLIFAENGVWQVSGGAGGFSATQYEVRKVSSIGASNKDAVVVGDGYVMYWSSAGIYMIQPDKVSAKLYAQNITKSTINTFFNAIPGNALSTVSGIYDVLDKKLLWLYNDDPLYDTSVFPYSYNKALVFDEVLQCFYVFNLPYGSQYISAPFIMPVYQTNTITSEVVAGGVQVVAGIDNVTNTTTFRSRGFENIKYLSFYHNTATHSYDASLVGFTNTDFQDFGVDADAYFVTGYINGGDNMRQKDISTIVVHNKFVETGFYYDGNGNLQVKNPGSVQVQAQWNFSTLATTNDFTEPFESYRLARNYIPTGAGSFDYGYSIISTVNDLPGSGIVLNLKFSTQPLHDFYVYGWSMVLDGNKNV